MSDEATAANELQAAADDLEKIGAVFGSAGNEAPMFYKAFVLEFLRDRANACQPNDHACAEGHGECRRHIDVIELLNERDALRAHLDSIGAPGEQPCAGCINGPGCRVIPCALCGDDWHHLGFITIPFACSDCQSA